MLDAHEECEDPNHQELTASDIKNVLNAYTHYMITHITGSPLATK